MAAISPHPKPLHAAQQVSRVGCSTPNAISPAAPVHSYQLARLRIRAQATEAAAAAAAAAEAAPASLHDAHPIPAPPSPPSAFDIRPWQCREDLERAAWLRAEAYYENRSVGRFKASFVKQFAGQELYALLRRTKGPQPQCITFVAAPTYHSGSETQAAPTNTKAAASSSAGLRSCIGTLDVRLLDESVAAAIDTYGGRWPDGVPLEKSAAAYVSNVVVAEAQRGRGLGRQLVAAAAALAGERWRAAKLYCHVEVDNEPALALYRSCGFTQMGEELPPEEEGLGEWYQSDTPCRSVVVEPGVPKGLLGE